MTRRNLQLFGALRVESDDGNVPRFRSQRTMALLGYLVAERRAVTRDALAALFWPDEPQSTGRGSLRRELHNLSQILPDCWGVDRQTVQFIPSDHTAVDLFHFLEFEQAGRWTEAAELVRGEFLEGLYPGDNLEFETWLLGERERWRQRAEHILHYAIEQMERQGAYRRAISLAQRLLQLIPWHEESHRQVMRLLALSGQRSAALKQFELCKQVLWAELAVSVSAETVALYERIKRTPYFSRDNIPAVTTPLIGREKALAAIAATLADPEIRLITLTGIGGVGKTRLALGVAWQHTTGQFRDGVTFVSLAALGTADQIVSAIAQSCHLPLSTQNPRTPRQQVIDFLKTKQMLLILDNCEHLLDELEIVTQLLQASAQVCILTTSRERLRLHGEHLFALPGLGRAEDRADHPSARLFTVVAC